MWRIKINSVENETLNITATNEKFFFNEVIKKEDTDAFLERAKEYHARWEEKNRGDETLKVNLKADLEEVLNKKEIL